MKASFLPCLALLIAVTGPLAAADSFGSALERGTFSLNARLRYEGVEQTGLRSADALTLRTRLGFTTAPWQGFKAMAEGENIVAIDGDAYSQSGLNAGGAGRAAVGDPETTEVNQLLITYTTGQTSATLGRQRLVLDNARFIGDVAWRQNMQTFDAVVLQDKSLAKMTLTYGYLDQINRVFSRRHPQGRWKSDSHVANANYTGLPACTLSVYGYWLDFKEAALNSCATYGISFSGTQAISPDVKVLYRAEAATQRDHGSSLLDYRATYATVFAGLGFKPGTIIVGYEQLGSDHNVGFKTPLATLHAVNGWADLFLTTPATGLEETYVKATVSLPAALALAVSYHKFRSNAGSTTFGEEFDAQLVRKFGKSVTGMLKFANFRRDSLAFPNVQKVWAQVEFTY